MITLKYLVCDCILSNNYYAVNHEIFASPVTTTKIKDGMCFITSKSFNTMETF